MRPLGVFEHLVGLFLLPLPLTVERLKGSPVGPFRGGDRHVPNVPIHCARHANIYLRPDPGSPEYANGVVCARPRCHSGNTVAKMPEELSPVPKHRVLMADTDTTLLASYRECLARNGFQVATATTGV